MPSSAKDRFTVDFEKIFFFTKNNKYWFEQQKEPLSQASINDMNGRKEFRNKGSNNNYGCPGEGRDRNEFYNPEGRNKRCVNLVDTQYMRLKKDLTFATKQHILQEMLKRGLV